MPASNALSALPAPVRETDIPKPSLKSSKPGAEAARPQSQSARQDLTLRVTSRDGDVLELRQRRESDGLAQAGDSVPEHLSPEKDEVRAWIDQVKKELAEQQVELLKRLMDGKEDEDGGLRLRADGTLLSIEVAGAGDDGAPANVPEYWNAENTSDRIATFAIAMAAAAVEQGGDAQAKVEEIVNAVTAGFDQAHAATGELPGAAGRLYRDTKDLVFEKLKKWLAEAESGSYNQTAENQSDPPENIEAWN